MQMHPFSVSHVGTRGQCTEITFDICSEVGLGCVFELPSTVSSSPSPDTTQDSAGQGQDSGTRARNLGLAFGSVGFFLILVAAAAVYFIVLPWWRGSLRDPSLTSLDDVTLAEPGECEEHTHGDRSPDNSPATTNFGDFAP